MRKKDGHFKDRTGEKNIANNGLKMEIIAYHGCDDVDIRFEDGVITKHQMYKAFTKGNIKHPDIITPRKRKDHIGETNIASCGMQMKIIAFRDYKDMDVEFENGIIREHCAYHNFLNGKIAYAKGLRGQKNIGKTNKNKNGMVMEIIAYRNKSDIDVRFEDGTIAEHRTMDTFRKGNLSYPKPSRIGETQMATCGYMMTIVEYRAYNDIDIQFDDPDKTIVYNKEYKSFKDGTITFPDFYKKRIGERSMSRNGKWMTIIAYRKSSDIDVKFDDGTVIYHKSYDNFKKGNIAIPVELSIARVGEKVTCKNGLTAEIIAYHSCLNIDVKFSDGHIETNRTYYDFKHDFQPKKVPKYKNSEGMIVTTSSGIRVKLLRYRISKDVDIQFEDGTIIEHTHYMGFTGRSLLLPKKGGLFHGVKVKKAFCDGDKTYYECVFPDNTKDLLTPQEIMTKQGIQPVF